MKISLSYLPIRIESSARCKRLRELLREKKTLMVPGAFNALSARMIEKEGFDAIYLSGAVLSNSVGGVPDIGLMALSESRDHSSAIASATTLPLIVDADTGYGGAENAARTVEVLEKVGVSAIHIEDQKFPKRCGHLDGKELVEVDEMVEKIYAAAEAKRSKDFMIIARTDARGVESYDAAVKRAEAYLKAGADGIFPEALQGKEEFERFAKDLSTTLMANMTEFGKSPLMTVDELSEMGYGLIIYPVTLQRLAMKAVEEGLRTLKRDKTQEALLEAMQTRKELYELVGYKL